MSTEHNNDRWGVGNTIVGEQAYRDAPAGVFIAEPHTVNGWTAMLGGGRFVDSDGGDGFDTLFCERTIIDRPADAPASIPHYPPQDPPADMNAGRKDDSGKNRLDLLPPHALWQVGLALTFGAKEYGDNNWRKVENARARYTAALLRHITLWMMGERNDKDSGLHHLAHAGACVLFLLDVEAKESEDACR